MSLTSSWVVPKAVGVVGVGNAVYHHAPYFLFCASLIPRHIWPRREAIWVMWAPGCFFMSRGRIAALNWKNGLSFRRWVRFWCPLVCGMRPRILTSREQILLITNEQNFNLCYGNTQSQDRSTQFVRNRDDRSIVGHGNVLATNSSVSVSLRKEQYR